MQLAMHVSSNGQNSNKGRHGYCSDREQEEEVVEEGQRGYGALTEGCMSVAETELSLNNPPSTHWDSNALPGAWLAGLQKAELIRAYTKQHVTSMRSAHVHTCTHHNIQTTHTYTHNPHTLIIHQ